MIGVQAQDAGTYYIQNVSNGKWLGPGNNWGTQASVLNHGEYWKLAKISEGVYTLESVVSNGGSNYYLTGEWCDGGATKFTFAAVAGKENTYTIANGKYLTTNGTTVNVSGTDATAAVSQWKLISQDEMASSLAAATVENPVDATFLMDDHTFGRNNRYVSSWTNDGGCDMTGGNSNKHCAEKYHGTYNVYQTLANAPVGCYRLTAQGFYRQDGSDNDHLPVLYANTTTATFPLKTGSENSMADACASFEQGKYAIDPIYVYVGTKGELTVGTKLENNGSLWCIWDNFELTYYGDHTVAEVVLADYVKAYNAAMSEATSFTEESMWADDWTALQNAISANTLDLSDVTQAQLETATANLVAANTAAAAAINKKAVYDNAVALINGGTNVDLTSIVSNASFEDGNLNGWTSVNGGGVANNNNWSGKVGTYFVERWTGNGESTQSHLSDGTLTHDALVLPAGLYTITANAQNQEQKNGKPGTGYFLYANEEKAEISASNTYSTTILLEEDKSELVIKFALEGCTGNWISCDDVHLTYVGEDFPAYTLVTGKMNAAVAAAQTAADEAFQANKTIANYNALTAAITAAQASKDAYAAAAVAIANANDLKEAHNLASTTAYSTFAAAIAAIETPYNENTLSTDDANAAGLTLGTVVTGWRAAAGSAAVAYLNDGFSLNAFDAALYINTWSIEGEDDGSNFKVPFYEYFAGEGNALPEKTWTGKVEGLENGTYSVSVWVRERSINASTDAADLTGISMNVNGGTAVDVTEGDVVPVQEGKARFQHKVYTAEGYVTDGVLNVNFDIAAGNNIHWLSFKNISYERIGDIPEADAADYEALNNAISAVSSKVAGFESGEYAPYNNIEAFAALAVAQNIDQTATNAKPTVQAATAALNDATWTANAEEVNAVYDGDFAIQPEHTTGPTALVGWNAVAGIRQLIKNTETDPGLNYASAKAGVFSWGGTTLTYGSTDGYEMPLAAHTIYELTFKVAGWRDGDLPTWVGASVLKGEEGMANMNVLTSTVTKRINDSEGNPFVTCSVLFVTGEAGNYVLAINPNKHNVITDITLFKAASQTLTFADDAAMPSYAPGTYPRVEVTRTLIGNQWNTLVLPFEYSNNAWTIKEFTASDDEKLTFSDVEGGTMTAGTPYLVKPNENENTTSIIATNVAVVSTSSGVTQGDFTFTPVYTQNTITGDGSNYFVATGTSTLYRAMQDIDIKGFRAYFHYDGTSSEAREVVINFDGETAINAVEAAEEGEALKDGKYLIDGKVVIVKNGVKYSANGQILK